MSCVHSSYHNIEEIAQFKCGGRPVPLNLTKWLYTPFKPLKRNSSTLRVKFKSEIMMRESLSPRIEARSDTEISSRICLNEDVPIYTYTNSLKTWDNDETRNT